MTQRNALVMNAGRVQQLQSGDSFLTGQAPGRRNALINGNFDIWQRGTSFTPVRNVRLYTADRWSFTYTSNPGVVAVTRDTSIPTVAQSNTFSTYSYKVGCNTSGTLSAGDYTVIRHHIEGYNFRNIAQRPMTLSFWVKAFQTGTFCVAFNNSGGDKSYVAEYTINSSNTWEKKVINIPASPSTGTWNYDTGIGLVVVFTLGVGSTYQTTPNAWQSSLVFGTSNQTNFLSSSSNTFQVTQVQLEQGDSASDFERRLWAQKLLDCQRYFFCGGYYASGEFESATTFDATLVLPAPMRVTPTVGLTTTSPAVAVPGTALYTAAGATAALGAGSINPAFANSFDIVIFGFAGAVINKRALLNDNYILLDAEL